MGTCLYKKGNTLQKDNVFNVSYHGNCRSLPAPQSGFDDAILGGLLSDNGILGGVLGGDGLMGGLLGEGGL
ncbi:hypothetical protein J6590_094095 [Homalodisca vitripennis]|nr:hypothetical protein J6590_094095 [Homalodisca vitripennis]